MKEEAKKELEAIFGERVAFNRIERMLYASDLGTLPDIVKNRIETLPDAVVQPREVDDLAQLLDLASKYKIPLVPRGSGTAGYGGAVPVKAGIVVDFYRMKDIVEVDEGKKQVSVEPGIVWNDLEKELRKRGLALRVYPTSAPSSTVGGWIANGGGTGVGSFEYGFGEVVYEVEIVTSKGIKKLSGDDIRLVFGMAGTTGFITRVSLLLREAEDDCVSVGAFGNLEDLVAALEEVREKKLSLWDVRFRDPNHVALSKKALDEQCGKMSVHKKPRTNLDLPADKFVAIFAYPESKSVVVAEKLAAIIKANRGEPVDDGIAKSEWDDRFYVMRVKALGPSIIPSQVVVPLEKLLSLKDSLSGLALHGSLASKGQEVVLLSFALEDERRRGFPLAYSRSLSIIHAAVTLGGKPYSIGMFFSDYAERLIGESRLASIYNFKKEVDPNRVMNPGKIFPPSLDKHSPLKMINFMTQFANKGATAVGILDRLFGGVSPGKDCDEKGALGKQPFGKLAVWDTFACARCGYCRPNCTQFNAIGWESASPRGKFKFLKEYLKGKAKFDMRMGEIFFTCTTCGCCNLSCQLKIPANEHGIVSFRPTIKQEGFRPPEVYLRQSHNIVEYHNPVGSPSKQRTAWVKKDIRYKDRGEIGFFVGCQASYNHSLSNMPINAFRILNKAGIEPAYLGQDEWCCGGPLVNIGCTDVALENVGHNINEINKRGIKTLIVTCAGCWAHFTHVYPPYAQLLKLNFDVKAVHIVEVISQLIEEERLKLEYPVKLPVTYHDSCHIGRDDGIFDPPRRILQSIPGLKLIEMVHNREDALCCGRHTLRYPRLGMAINSKKINEARETGAHALIANCPTCEGNLRLGVKETGNGLEVLDITDLVIKSMGLPLCSVSKLSKLLHSASKA